MSPGAFCTEGLNSACGELTTKKQDEKQGKAGQTRK
jgi:hypothetical protein